MYFLIFIPVFYNVDRTNQNMPSSEKWDGSSCVKCCEFNIKLIKPQTNNPGRLPSQRRKITLAVVRLALTERCVELNGAPVITCRNGSVTFEKRVFRPTSGGSFHYFQTGCIALNKLIVKTCLINLFGYIDMLISIPRCN